MTDQQFDDFTRRLAKPLSRRQAMRAVAGAMVGGLLARFGTGKAEAQWWGNNTALQACDTYCTQAFGANTPGYQQCTRAAYQDYLNGTRNSLCFSPCGPSGSNCAACPHGNCKNCLCGDGTYSNTTCCAGGKTCVSGGICCPTTKKVCTGPSGSTTCASCCQTADCSSSTAGHLCVNGSCGCRAAGDCPTGSSCNTRTNTCEHACGTEHSPCNGGCCSAGTCVAGNTSAACGTGGGTCSACTGATPTCVSGVCMATTCTTNSTCPPLHACINSLCTTSCDVTHPCNTGCCSARTGGTCVSGTTNTACGTPTSVSGLCVTCTSDACNLNVHCVSGHCVGTPVTCPPQTCHTNVHCSTASGGCVSTPLTGTSCASGTCCSGACFDLTSTNTHCGSCTNNCTLTASGTCCSSVCTNTQTSTANCGSCGHNCSVSSITMSGTVCISGVCGCRNNGQCSGNSIGTVCISGSSPCAGYAGVKGFAGTQKPPTSGASVHAGTTPITKQPGKGPITHSPVTHQAGTPYCGCCTVGDCGSSSAPACDSKTHTCTDCTTAGDNASCNAGGYVSGLCCGGNCLDMRQLPQNCGSCGHDCTLSVSGSECVNSACGCDSNTENSNATGCQNSTAGTYCLSNNTCGCLSGADCPGGMTCVNNVCTPPCGPGSDGTSCNLSSSGTGICCGGSCCANSCCGGACVDTTSDPANCGTCGNSCAMSVSGSICFNSSCGCSTYGGPDEACGNSPRGGYCSSGNCGVTAHTCACKTASNCSISSYGRACVNCICGCNTAADCPSPSTEVCTNHRCTPACTGTNNGASCPLVGGGTGICCSGTCVDNTTATNCGTCGNSCASNANGHACVSGACGCSTPSDCPSPSTAVCTGTTCSTCTGKSNGTPCGTGTTTICCNGSCVNGNTNATCCGFSEGMQNCATSPNGAACVSGTCGCITASDCTTPSANGPVCVSGSCGCTTHLDCPSTAPVCASHTCVSCVEQARGTPCGSGTTTICCSGTCVDANTSTTCCGLGKGMTTCTPGEVCCSGICTNTQTSATHCGNCTTTCANNTHGHACVSGVCGCAVQADCPTGSTCNTTTHTCGPACTTGHTCGSYTGSCGVDPTNCTCAKATGNTAFCTDKRNLCGNARRCTTTANCPTGQTCVTGSCCTDTRGNPVNVCLPPCGQVNFTPAAATKGSSPGGMTITGGKP